MGFAPADIFGISGMNKIYKLKFDKRRNELVVVSEITAGLGKAESTGHIAGLLALPFRKLLGTLSPLSLITGLVMGVLPMMALANPNLPTGGQIVGGQGSISVAGNQMTIHQGSQNMAANWNSFDIGKNNTVQFVQPNSSAVALNRVTGGHESQIMGSLNANGKVFLINPNGVLFGKGASVNTAGLVASTKNINTADFMKGNYTFSGGSVAGAEVVNQGSLTTTKGGFIVLAANRVKNSGHIITPSGKAVLAAADTVALQLDNSGLTSVAVNGSVVNALVDNRGLISATNGQVYLTARGKDMLLNTVVNNSGTIEAKGLSANGGIIRLDGGDSGVVNQSGQLLADSESGRGGRVTLEGQNIHLAGKSQTSVSGKNGGGDIYVGGGWQGKDSHIKNASKVVMDKSATIDVSATQHGDGGKAVLWSDDYTNFQGTILAKGGRQSGNGGEVETSSHNNLQAFGQVDASSARGKGGQWLLDPADVTIVGTGSESGISSSTTDNNDVFSPTASGAQILNTSIVNQLNTDTNVTVQTSGTDADGQTGNITVNASIVKTAGSDATLTLTADNKISTADRVRISASSGKLNLNLLAANTSESAVISLGKFINISLNGGDFYTGPASAEHSVSLQFTNNGKVAGGNVIMDVAGGLGGYAYSVLADKNLTINGSVSSSTGWGVTTNFSAGNLLTLNAAQGNISLSATDSSNGGGRVALSGTNGINIQASNGNISLNTVSGSNNGINVTSGKDITLQSSGNITLAQTNMSASGHISLLGAGGSTAMTKLTGGTLSSNGGNIVIDQLNHTTTDSEGNSVTNPNGMTVKLSGVTLNTTSTTDATQKGDISLNAYNPNVSLNAAAYKNTVRNAGYIMELSGNTSLTAGNVTMLSVINGNQAAGLPIYLNAANITADNDITLTGRASDRANLINLELRGANNSLTATKGNVAINVVGGGSSGIYVNGTASSNVILTAGQMINLTAKSWSGTALKISNVTLNAATAALTGVAQSSGKGFSIVNSTFTGALSDLANVTLSSAGSGVGVTNALDSSVVNATNRDNLLSKSIDNMTSVDMGGDAIFDDTRATTKGWTKDYTSDAKPRAGWIFNNTTVTAGGDVNLKGAGFTNSTLNITNGSLNITNNGSAFLTGSTITANNGSVTVHAGSGNLDLTKGNISAKNDINLTTNNGTIRIAGTNATSPATITSAEKNIILSANSSDIGVYFGHANISAPKGNLTVDVTSSITRSRTFSRPEGGAVYFFGKNSIQAKEGVLNVVLSEPNSGSSAFQFGNMWAKTPTTTNVTFVGDFNFKGNINSPVTTSTDEVIAAPEAHLWLFDDSVKFNFKDGTTKIISTSGLDFMNVVNANRLTDQYGINFENANLEVNIDDGLVNYFRTTQLLSLLALLSIDDDTYAYAPDYTRPLYLTGDGNISIKLDSSSSRALFVANGIDNTGLNGTVSIDVVNNCGTAIEFPEKLTGNLVNATIKGESKGDGVGVNIKGGVHAQYMNLGNNTISGVSANGSGIWISGKNIGVTNGSLNGTSGGRGAGVAIVGGSNYTIDGANVTGQSVDGTGVSASGNLSVNNNATLIGTASGNGTGVTVAGDLQSEGGVTINGTATTGDGVKVTGDTLLANATLSGKTDSGSGVNIAGNLTTDNNTLVAGSATDGTGVSLGASLSGANVTGVSDSGAGVTLADNANVTQATLNGTSTSGSGVAVTGNVVMDDVTAQKLNATSVSGSGLLLDNNANVSVINISSAEKTKTDAEGNPELDTSGNPVTETVTTVAPVTVPVSLSGTSQTGSGIATAGNVVIRGITLNGTTSSDSGVGVTLGGNLTIADTISGVTASTSGNGTALVLNGATVNAAGYTAEGKDFTLNASASGEAGTAIATLGDNTLNNVMLNGAVSGNGSAVVVGGVLTTDKDIVATTQGDKGTALVLKGGHLQSAVPDNTVTVNATASGDNATAIAVVQTPDGTDESALSNVTLNATASKGSAVQLEGTLNTYNTVIHADVTGTGTALNVSGGTLHALSGTTVTATADSGQAAKVTNGKLTGETANALNISATTNTGQPALTVSGASEITNSRVSGKNAGTGDAVTVGGTVTTHGGAEIHGETVNGTAVMVEDGASLTSATQGGLVIHASATGDKGTGVSLGEATLTGSQVNASATSGDAVSVANGSVLNGTTVTGNASTGTGVNVSGNASLTNASLNGTTETGTGSVVSGNLTADSTSSVSGSATQGGTGVNLSGNVTGGSVAGDSAEGTGVNVSGSNSTVTNTTVTGNTTNGTGVTITGNLTNAGNSTVAGNANGNGTGTDISGALNGKVSGSSTTGTGAHVSDGAHISAGSSVAGSSDTGSGAVVEGNINSNGQISGTSNKGDGLNLNATVSGGGKLTGSSVDGTGAHVSGNSTMSGGSLSGSTTNGSGLHLDGDLKHTPDTSISNNVVAGGRGQESTGEGDIIEVKPPVEPDNPDTPVQPDNPDEKPSNPVHPEVPDVDKQAEKMMSVISRQQVITAQKLHRGTVLQTSGYRPSDEPVEIEVCVDGECQSTNVHHQLSSASEGKDRTSEKDAKRK